MDKVVNYWYDIIDNSVFYIKGGLFMTSKILQELLKSTAFLGVLLLIGLYLRAKISLFRRFLVPASVIGGFLGLLLGPEVLGLTGYSPISPEWNKTWSCLQDSRSSHVCRDSLGKLRQEKAARSSRKPQRSR